MDLINYTLAFLVLFFTTIVTTLSEENTSSRLIDDAATFVPNSDSVAAISDNNSSDAVDNVNYTETVDLSITLPVSSELSFEEACLSEANRGPCTSELVRFFYDPKTRRCRQFIYSGCEGNKNQFSTEADCLQTCTQQVDTNSENGNDGQEQNENYSNQKLPSNDADGSILTLDSGNGETSFTFAAEYPFIQLKAVDISDFQLRYIYLNSH